MKNKYDEPWIEDTYQDFLSDRLTMNPGGFMKEDGEEAFLARRMMSGVRRSSIVFGANLNIDASTLPQVVITSLGWIAVSCQYLLHVETPRE